jgi:cytochrome c
MQIEGKQFSLKRLVKVAAVTAGGPGFAFSVLFGLATAGSAQDQAKPKDLPNAPGKDVVVRTCNSCHAATVVLEHGQTREQWEETITKMIGMGAQGSDEDFNAIVDYLTKNVPPATAAKPDAAQASPAPSAAASAAPTAAVASGKAIFTEKCAACHNADSSDQKVGPGLKGLYARGTFSSDNTKFTDESLTKFIQDGKGMMPPFKGSLDAAKLQDLIAYLKTL